MPPTGRTMIAIPSSEVITFWRNERGTNITLSRFCPSTLPSLVCSPMTRSG